MGRSRFSGPDAGSRFHRVAVAAFAVPAAFALAGCSAKPSAEGLGAGALADGGSLGAEGSTVPPADAPSSSESANCTVVTDTMGSIRDDAGNAWTLVSGPTGGFIVNENGQPAGTTLEVMELAYVNHAVSQKNTGDNWYVWQNGTWATATDPTIACADNKPPGGDGGTMPARTYDLLNILSLQGCTSGGAAECQGTGQFIQDVQYLGVKHYRDAFNASSPTQLQVLQALAQAGISMIAQIAMPWGATAIDIPTVINQAHVWQGFAPNAVFALEGANEPDGFGFFSYEGQPCGSQGNSDSWVPCADLMRDYYKAVKADGSLKDVPFFGVTRVGNEWPNVGLMFTTVPVGSGTAYDGDTLQEYLTDHVYPAWQSQYWNGKNELASCQTNDPVAGNAFMIQMHYDHVVGFGDGYHGYASDADAKSQPHAVTEFGYATDSTQTLGSGSTRTRKAAASLRAC